MNYIYDIYINLNKTLYDFYEWNKNDNLIHIKKIPIFMIDNQNLKKILTNEIKVDTIFLKKIECKTEVWSPNTSLTYCTLFTDCNDIIAIQFDANGNSIKKSLLFIDEEADTLEDMEKLNICNIKFEIIGKSNYILKTRKEIKTDNFIDSELENIDTKKLNYICYECLGTINKNSKENIKLLKKLDHNSKKYENLCNILKLTSKAIK